MSKPVIPPDSELAEIFGNNTRIFRAMRELFKQAGDISPAAIEEALIAAGMADGKAVQALDTLERIANAVESLSFAPQEETVTDDDLTPPIIPQELPDDLSPVADQVGTDNSTDVTLVGSFDYLTLSDQEITMNAIDLDTDVTNDNTAFNKDFGLIAGTVLEGDTTPSDIGAEPAFSKNTAFNKDFGTSADTVLEGDTTLSDLGGQPLDATLTTIAATNPTTDEINFFTGLNVASVTSLTAFGRSLIDDVSNTAARTTLNVDVAGTDNSTDVTLAGTNDYITIVGQVITRNDIDLTTDVTGVLPLANGGTNDSTVTSANIGHLKSTDQDLGTADSVVFDGIKTNGRFNVGTNTEVTISSGAITITGAFHRVDTEGDAGSDDLDTINGATLGDRVVLMSITSSRNVVVKDGSNLRLAGDFTLNSSVDTIELLFLGTVWVELSRSDNA